MLALIVGWLGTAGTFHLGDRQAMTRTMIRHHALTLELLLKRGDALPKAMEDLVEFELSESVAHDVLYRDDYEASLYVPWEGWACDQWGNPFNYETDGFQFEIVSLGRDGKKGGSGFNRDLSSREDPFQRELPTLFEFLFLQPSGGVRDTALLAGLMSAAAARLLDTGREASRGTRRAGAVVIAIGALLLTVLLAELHVPLVSGH